MTERTTLITGATGNTGNRIVTRLVTPGASDVPAYRVVAAGRRPVAREDGTRAVRFDWYDPATYAGALQHADRMYLVPPIGDSDPAAGMLPFLRQAREAGVRRAVLLGSSAIPAGGPGIGEVYDRLAELFDQWAVLRPSWFMQNFTGHHPHADSIRADGVIMSATGEGRVGFVDADDIAEVAVHALLDEPAPNTELIITGPQALSYGDIATIISELGDRPVRHRPVSREQLRERLLTEVPAEFAALLVGLDHSISQGTEDRVTDTVERLTGRPARSFREHLEQTMR